MLIRRSNQTLSRVSKEIILWNQSWLWRRRFLDENCCQCEKKQNANIFLKVFFLNELDYFMVLYFVCISYFQQDAFCSIFLQPLSLSLCPFHFLSQEDCQPCLPGYYCNALGLSAPSGECWEGFFCLEGADRPDPPLRDSRGGPCPKGHHTLKILDICI